MFSSLHTLARLTVLTIAGLSLIALTTAQMHPRGPIVFMRENPWEVLAVETRGVGEEIRMVDRETGAMKVVPAPSSDRWDFLAASPMMAEDGTMEAVGRFASPQTVGPMVAAEGAVGLVRIRLPKGDVLERHVMEIMPTGRPAWDPSGGSRVIFPSATGQLFSYQFAGDGASESASIRPLEWRCEPPGGREPFIVDPVWPRDPAFRNLVIASLAPAKLQGDSDPVMSLTPWWLELDPNTEAIVAAGPLFDSKDPSMAAPHRRIRYPSVVHRDGRLELIYLSHDPLMGKALVYSAELELGQGSTRLRIRSGSATPVSEVPFTIGAMVPTLDARLAFSASALGGHVVTVSLDDRSDAVAAQ